MPLFGRSDGVLVRDVSPTRAIMPHIMPTVAGSSVYFEQILDVTRAQAWLDARAGAGKAKLTLFHVFSWAVVQTLAARPRMNRFTSGGHLYQRKTIDLAFSAKKAMSDDAPIVALKRTFDPAATFDQHVEMLLGGVREGRSKEKNATEKELSILTRLPAFVLGFLIALGRWLDGMNLLPQALMATDPLYASVFIANLGSVGLDAVYHHLYDWGNIPIFAALGRVRDESRDGATRKVCTVRYTFDERIEDGLYCARSLDLLRERIERWGADEPPASGAAEG